MNIKIAFVFIFLVLTAGITYGTSLLRNEIIQISDLYAEEDPSSFDSDGPVILYNENEILNYAVIPVGSDFKTDIRTVRRSDTLTCNISETGQQFRFTLKDTIITENCNYDLPEKMFIISDIEGEFRGFQLILKAAGVIDTNLQWTYGKGHLVFTGDFFDRGLNVTQCLWLIYKLEREAELQGGKVHFILGNHEMMNLKGKFRYVRNKYLVNADSLKLNYEEWYSQDSELGRWLRSKNGIEKIGDYLFLHAGISMNFPKDKYSLKEINDNIRLCIDREFEKGESQKDIFIGNESPLWYRGIADMEEKQEDIENTLNTFSSFKMIIGHTIVDEIKYLYDQKVIAIDLEHKLNSEKGIMYALLFENKEFYVIDSERNKSLLK